MNEKKKGIDIKDLKEIVDEKKEEINFKDLKREIDSERQKNILRDFNKIITDELSFGDTSKLRRLLESIDKLRHSVEEGARSSNRLANRIKGLTWALVIIGILTLAVTFRHGW